MDSGIGGLNLLKNMCLKYPNENFLYFGDNKNAPYGNKSAIELLDITRRNLEYIKQFNIKKLVLGCNTLSTCLLDEITKIVKVDTIGVTPPVKQVLKQYNNVLLVSTVRTAEHFIPNKKLEILGLRSLAEEIEKNIFDLSKVKLCNHLKSYNQKITRYDAVILGCTHYGFIKKQFFDHFQPQIIISSEDFFENEFIGSDKTSKLQVNFNSFSVLFVGDSAEFNKKVWCFMWS